MKTNIKLIVVTIIYVLNIQSVFSQIPTFEWASHIEGSSMINGISIATDNSGNVITVGTFKETGDFNPGIDSTHLTSLGEYDIYIQKLDVNGNFMWVKQVGGVSLDRANSITIDDSNNIYITGRFSDTVDFDPGIGITNLVSAGNLDFFIQKLDSDGELLWVKQIGGGSSEYGLSVDLDIFGNIYTTGWFMSTVDFDPGVGVSNLITAGNDDTFIQKLDQNGDFIWAKQIGGNSDDRSRSLTIGPSGNIYTVGYFKGTADFDPGIDTSYLTSVGDFDIFVQKLDTNGNLLWANQIGGTSIDQGFSITVDDSNNVYITGLFSDTVDFDPGIGIHNLTSAGDNDIFIQKLDANGNFLWVKQIGGTYYDHGHSITLDNSGDIYTTGSINGDIFIQKSESNGDSIWFMQLSGQYGGRNSSIILDNFKNIYTTGIFSGNVDFDPGTGVYNISSNGLYDAFVHKLSQCTSNMPVPNVLLLPDLSDQCSISNPTAPIATNSCGYIIGVTETIFPITTMGTTLITWTYDDGNGNILTQTQNVIIEDSINPIPTVDNLSSLTALCEITTVDAAAPTSTDNCSGLVTASSNVIFPITNQSITEIIWTYNDGNGNTTTQNQTINWVTPDISTTLNGLTITANNTNATYQWLDCNNNYNSIVGDTNVNYTATANGNYAVEISENGCVDTSACVSITNIGINEWNNLTLAVHPNPSSDVFNITFEKAVEQAWLNISNTLGQLVYKTEIKQTSETRINLKDKPSGIYYLTIISQNQQKTIELIKE